MNVHELDNLVHNLIHKLLVMSEEDPAVLHSVHLHASMLQHQELIQAVKEEIKPGLLNVLFKAFNKEMIKDYLNALKQNKKEENEIRVKEAIRKKLTTNMDLNVKTENYAIKNKGEDIKKDAEIIQRKLEVQKAGLRDSG